MIESELSTQHDSLMSDAYERAVGDFPEFSGLLAVGLTYLHDAQHEEDPTRRAGLQRVANAMSDFSADPNAFNKCAADHKAVGEHSHEGERRDVIPGVI